MCFVWNWEKGNRKSSDQMAGKWGQLTWESGNKPGSNSAQQVTTEESLKVRQTAEASDSNHFQVKHSTLRRSALAPFPAPAPQPIETQHTNEGILPESQAPRELRANHPFRIDSGIPCTNHCAGSHSRSKPTTWAACLGRTSEIEVERFESMGTTTILSPEHHAGPL